MGVRNWRQLLIAGIALGALVSPPTADAQVRAGAIQNQNRYEQGYRQGVRQGERDARAGARFDARRDTPWGVGRDGYQAGYTDGYRAGYDRVYVLAAQRGRPGVRENRNVILRPGGVDPVANGYERGFEVGLKDGRDGDRYDPVRNRNYRDGDEGYSDRYGSRDAYKNNYRTGFRQGYEEGYRQGSRNRR